MPLRLSFAVFLFLTMQSTFSQEVDSVRKTEQNFNRGFIFNLPQAIQAQIPGLLVSRPGSNPNAHYDMVYRGYHTFQNRMTPLLILDGIPGVKWEMVDPFLVDSVSVRRGSHLAKMGLQAGGGVFDANRKRNNTEGLYLHFIQDVTVENYQREFDVLSAEEYRNEAPPGNYIGNESTDWLDVLTQTAWSSHTGVKLAYNKNSLRSFGTISHRNVNGIQKMTGFNQLSIYGGLDYSFLKGKIEAGGSVLRVDRKADIGNSNFFQAAVGMNPTVGQDQEILYFFPTGGNPWLRMNADQNQLSSNMLLGQGYVTLRPIPIWSINARLGIVKTNKDQQRFDGIAAESGFGIVEINRSREDKRTYFELSSDIKVTKGNWSATPGLRFTSQKISYETTGDNLYSPQGPPNPPERRSIPVDYGEFTVQAMGGYVRSNWKNQLFVDALFQVEGSSNLGIDAGWGQFMGIDLEYHFGKRFKVFSSYSRTGLIPEKTGLSKTVIQFEPYYRVLHYENPNLKWENTNQLEIGGSSSFFKGKLFTDLRFFLSNSSDFINLMQAYDWDGNTGNIYYPFSYQNFGKISNRGMELVLSAGSFRFGQVGYRSSLNTTLIRSAWTDLEGEYTSLEGYPVDPIGRWEDFFYFNTLRTGEPIGTGRTLDFIGIDKGTGDWVFRPPSDPQKWISQFYPNGQNIPKWWMGWSHQFAWKKWNVDLFLRGVFGHQNANETNLRYGGVIFQSQNALTSYRILKEQGMKSYNRFSNYFVEKSGYVSLHYLSISREFNFLIREEKLSSTLSLIANNLFYITSYSAADPEVRLKSQYWRSIDDHVESADSYFATGIDWSSTWLPSRSFTLSFQVRF